MKSYYYTDDDNAPVGPMPRDELIRLREIGVIRPETYVVEAGRDTWIRYAEMSEESAAGPAKTSLGLSSMGLVTAPIQPAPEPQLQTGDHLVPSNGPTVYAGGANYDPTVNQKLAEQWFRQADSALTWTIVGGCVLSIVFSAVTLGLGLLVAPFIIIASVKLGKSRALTMRTLAQFLLCQVQIEKNTSQSRARLGVLLVGFLLFSSLPAKANEEVPPIDVSLAFYEKLGVDHGQARLPGVSFAEGLTQLTGVAISPLLGVTVIGAWTYLRSDPAVREALPWVCHPWFWGTGLGILVLCFFKDSIGSVLPSLLKKPFDLVELFESKFSALIASAAFVPFLCEQYATHERLLHSRYSDGGPASSGELAVIPQPLFGVVDALWILTPLAIFCFFVVWIVSHVIQVLIVLSPFSFISALLKAFRLALLGTMGLLYLISPILAAIFAAVIVIVSLYLAPRAFRLSVYGSVLSFDFLRSLVWKSRGDAARIHGFITRRGYARVRHRMLGYFERKESGRIVFHTRRAFVGPTFSAALPADRIYAVTSGLLFPTLHAIDPGTGKQETYSHLLPRYRHHLPLVAASLGLEIRETPALRGFRNSLEWLKLTLRTEPAYPGVQAG